MHPFLIGYLLIALVFWLLLICARLPLFNTFFSSLLWPILVLRIAYVRYRRWQTQRALKKVLRALLKARLDPTFRA